MAQPVPPEQLRTADATGRDVIVDGRRLRPHHPLAWRRGTVVRCHRQPWWPPEQWSVEVEFPPLGEERAPRIEPLPPAWLLEDTPELQAALQRASLWPQDNEGDGEPSA